MSFFSLSGKTALVTGAATGIGRGICHAIGEAGANIVATDIDENGIAQTLAELKSKGYNAIALRMDVADEASVQGAFDATVKQFGSLDILVNNAGVVRTQSTMDISPNDWDFIFNVNTKALFFMSQLFAKHIKSAAHPGRIVNIASNAGKVGFVNQLHYNASKAAVINITQCLARDFALENIDINANCVCPGAVDTQMLRSCMDAVVEESGGSVSIEDLRSQWGPAQLKRLTQPIEVGRVVVFLASDAAVLIRGQAINVDAGNTSF